VFLPVWPVVVIAAVLQRPALLVLASALALSHVALAGPELAARSSVRAAAKQAPKLVVFDANVQAGNREIDAFADELRAADPDVVTLEEAGPGFVDALDRSGAISELPYRYVVARRDPFAFAVLSRFPLRASSTLEVAGRPIAVRTTVTAPSGALPLFVVHPVAPYGPNVPEWKEHLAAIRAAAKLERGPLLLVGDFNATWGHGPFRDLLDDGFTDAAAARGHPFQMTWPANRRVPPFLRIDHALTRGRIEVVDITRGRGLGSDHRPLILRLATT
jgi:endonuclease/exonuclease/phosphatase (EEP) superfamily protein YafD